MKNLVLASVMAVASLFSVTSQSQAASVTVTTTERSAPRHMQPRYTHERMRRDCRVKKVKTFRHGQMIVKETRVCR
ncbi:hypothetical protein EPK99_05560 [Neorhizobium lilium]|uniref:Uncharacterized protein n=1 Tax=Neorhizobium lilium TaxID=2503024 RepID=A0A444LN50_9HYPH|nr:hypothetical protein [Neorhizobium lilium]RWX81724.1 hypothetical protein EPK99_05560 [Neorhizobium lilium]